MILSLLFSLMIPVAPAADEAKQPCYMSVSMPTGCEGNGDCMVIENAHSSIAIAPIIEGLCPVTVVKASASGPIQAIISPTRGRNGATFIPVIPPHGIAYMFFPAGTTQFRISGVAYSGSFGATMPMNQGGVAISVFDDDEAVDISDHQRVGRCLWQTIQRGTKKVQYGAVCSGPELEKSRR